ncbi:uncharacterized protein LOC131219413 isoform X2 [Magnolia sinica]|uniref:uncharacterized protein LOC131219413 isoform X2 n=1 Tax=Magnolia sinica TaxID=86752 RepID=UPI002658E734|nr:uncharacterized protein LOC131219413 isoform X2 [Magnolia sinica]
MERSKGEMPSDDLEITSIGALYGGGPWEKKYWNCSRGKDRYPYPIGYHAVRTHAGNMYRMEIHEGPNGPLFVITSTEGDSCTGQTPDIAWEHFQKRNGPRVKTWHAKRFSCKIDGVELFGFRNPHVQRLLRELAANVNGTAERSSIHPNFCNGASSLEQEIRSPESCTYPDLLPYLGKRQSTGKRSRKQKKIAKSSISGANLKRFRSQELLNDAMVGIARKVNRGNRVDNHPTLLERSTESEIPNHHLTYSKKESVVTVNGEIPYFAGVEHHSDGKYMTLTSSTFDENCMVHEELGNISKLDPTAVAERGKDAILVKGDLFLESPKLSNRFVKEPILSQEHSKLVGAEVSCCVADVDLQVDDSLAATKESDGEIPVLTEFKTVKDLDYCVPDTLDLQDDVADSDSDSEGCKGGPCNVKDELMAAEKLLGNSTSHVDQVVAEDMPELKRKSRTCSLKCMDAPHKNSQDNEETSFPVIFSQDVVLSEGPIVGSHPEEEIGTSSASNASSGKSDFDSVGQDLVKSMMTLLLPQALPLLKKTSKKKRALVENAGVPFTKCDPCINLEGLKSLKENDGTHHVTDVISQGELAAGPNMGSNIDKEQKMHVSGIILANSLFRENRCNECLANLPFIERGSPPDVKSVIPDSFEDEQCACDVINLRTLHHDLGKAGPALLDKKARDPDISRFLGDADGVKESSNCHFGNGSKDEILLDEAAMLLNDPPENDTILVSVAPFSCTSPSRHNLLEGENNKHKNWDGSTIFTEINPEVESSKDKGIKIISDGIEGIATSGTVAVVDGISRYSCCEFVCKHEVPDVPADKPTYCPGFRSNKTGFSTEFEHAAILPSSSSKSLGTANIEIGETSSHFRHSSPGTDFQRINIQCDPANSDTHRLPTTTDNQDANFDTSRLSTTTDARTVNFVGGVGTIPEMQIDDNTAATGTGNSFFGIHKTDAAASTGDYTVSSHHVGKLPCSLRPSLKYSGPHSESIVFRNIENNSIPETNSTMNTLHTTEIGQATAADGSINKLPSFAHEIKLERQHHNMNISEPEGMLFNTAPHVTQNQALVVPATDESGFGLSIQDVERHQRDTVNKLVASYKPTECSNAASCMQGRISPDNNGTDVRENLASSDLPCYGKSVNNECEGPFSRSEINQKNVLQDDFFPKETKPCNEFGGFVELVGCYVHPMPILSVLLSMKDDIIHICVLCGPLGEQRRTLFIYDVPAKALSEKCPSFLGYASIMLPLSKGTFNKDIAFERSGLQFTPDGQCLVLLNSIKVPCCREQNIDCLCSVCTSDCCEENAVKVVHVQLGCVSVVVKLTTAESICCVLVYEPCYLVVAEESGRLHVWIMNSTWSAWVEEFTLPSFDYLCPSLLELRRIPKCASLFVGHNGIGGFGLWDISKRVLLSSFSSPGISIFQVLPVGLFGWQMNCPISTSSKVEEHIKEIIAATESWFSRVDENYDYLLPNGEDIAVWLLVSAASNSEAQYDCPGNDLNATPVGWWRLALLVKNTVIMGSILDPRASAAVASAGHGIIGTCDGLVYMWELSTGKKLANLKSLNGGVSCIATDANSGALAVAGNECQLLLYIQSPKHLQC